MAMITMARCVLVFLFASVASAQTAAFERILVPIALVGELPGAFGSRWTVQLAITNTADRSIPIFGYSPYPLGGCQFLCPTVPPTPAGITFFPIVAPGSSSQGAIILVDKRDASRVRFQLRIQDLSRESQTWGTEIPVVREADLFRDTLQLLDVPLTSRFRTLLRLYDVDARSDARVLLRFFRVNTAIRSPIDSIIDPAVGPPQPDVLLAERSVTLTVEQRGSDPVNNLGYAQVADLGNFPELQGVERVRIEARLITPGLRLWAFVSVTNNLTQHVTTITPH